jgi:hypothetical protein
VTTRANVGSSIHLSSQYKVSHLIVTHLTPSCLGTCIRGTAVHNIVASLISTALSIRDPVPRIPRDEVDLRNVVSSKHVPRVAQCLLDPLNGADAANAARLSITTEESPEVADQGQSATRDPLPEGPELVLPLKRQAHANEIEGNHASGKQEVKLNRL